MQRPIAVLAFVTSLLLFAPEGYSQVQCVCPKVPMYPDPSGGWVHYAIFCEGPAGADPCIEQYATGYIGPQDASPRSCLNNGCQDCVPVGFLPGGADENGIDAEPPVNGNAGETDDEANEPTPAAGHEVLHTVPVVFDDEPVVPSDMHFPGNPVNLGQLNTGQKFLDYLNDLSGNAYGSEFSASYVDGFSDVVVVSMLREKADGNGTEVFCAVVWKLTYDPPGGGAEVGVGNVGIEINGKPPGIPCTSLYNTVSTTIENGEPTHAPIPGIVYVEAWDERDPEDPSDDVEFEAMIRLNAGRDINGRYKPFRTNE